MHIKTTRNSLVGLIIIMTTAGAFAQTKTNIAIHDLTGQGVDQSSAVIISDRLRTELFNTGLFKVLERQSMEDVLKEQGFQQTGCVSDQCMVQMGQLLGVTNLISGTIGKLGAILTVNIRMVEVRTGEIIYTASVDCRCDIEDVLTKSIPSIVARLTKHMTNPTDAEITVDVAPQRSATGTISLQTDPPGARFFVNTINRGTTPISHEAIDTGMGRIRLELEGYTSISDSAHVSSDQHVVLQFSLKPLAVRNDPVTPGRRGIAPISGLQKPAIAPAPVKKPRKHSVTPKVIFGLVAVGAGVTGLVFNMKERQKIAYDAQLKQRYIDSGYTDATYYKDELQANATAAQKLDATRNKFYVAAGVGAAFFVISFAF